MGSGGLVGTAFIALLELFASVPPTCMKVSLYVGPKFDQINDQFQKHVYNPIECILGADTCAGMKPAEFRPEMPVIVAKGRNGNGGRRVFTIWDGQSY